MKEVGEMVTEKKNGAQKGTSEGKGVSIWGHNIFWYCERHKRRD